MRLAELVARYPNTRLATPADNARILDFFERTPMHTSAFDVQYRRRPDFFRLLRYQSDRAFVILTENNCGDIRGLATASLRPGWADGQPTTIGYLGDLRVRLDRQFSGAWRRLFADLVTCAPHVEEMADCTHWFTTVIDRNRAALAALGAGGPSGQSGRGIGRSPQPALVPIGPFTMRNLVMRLPLAGRSRPRGSWEVCDARATDTPALTDFFEEENRRVPLGFRGELPRRLLRWEGLSIAMLEAMAAGAVPVVADVGDLKDRIDDGVNGFVVEQDDIAGFAERILRLLDDEDTWRRCSSRAVSSAIEHSGVDAVARQWHRHLRVQGLGPDVVAGAPGLEYEQSP